MANLIESLFGFDPFGVGNAFGEGYPSYPSARPSRLNVAVMKLREAGHSVSPAEGVPGLWDVSGYPELTTGQLLDIASKL